MKQARGTGKWVATEDTLMSDPIRAILPPIGTGPRPAGVARPSSSLPSPTTGKLPHHAAGQSLWSTFWQEFCLENEVHERCHVPGDGRPAVDRHWAQFADNLPGRALVIDLGCGAGIVGHILLNRRADLRVTGVDWANVPAISRANLTVHPGISMEDLPFGDGGFDAAVSLFGIEYGNMEKTARELQRVLKVGARFSFLVHHRESEISREGAMRRRALRELISGRMKAAFLAGNTTGIDQQRRSLAKLFPAEPMIDIVSDYFLRNITSARAERQAIWHNLAIGLDPEIALLLHLERATKSAAEMASWLAALLSAMTLVSVSVLRRSSGEPIAWNVSGIR